jgi:hypothetical protein
MNYVKCLNNQTYFKNDLADTFDPHLMVGKVYRVAPPLPNDDPSLIRIFDDSYGEAGSEIGYLYPRSYFEPIDIYLTNGHRHADKAVTVHLSEALAGILHAEAIMHEMPVSALLRTWIEERLDLPEAMMG